MQWLVNVIGTIVAYAACAGLLYMMDAPTYIQVIGGWLGVIMWNQK